MLEFSRATLFYNHLGAPLPFAASINITVHPLNPSPRQDSPKSHHRAPSTPTTSHQTSSHTSTNLHATSARLLFQSPHGEPLMRLRARVEGSELSGNGGFLQWEVERSYEEVLCFLRLLGESSTVFQDLGGSRKSWRRSLGRGDAGLGLGLVEDLDEALRRWQSCGKNVEGERNGGDRANGGLEEICGGCERGSEVGVVEEEEDDYKSNRESVGLDGEVRVIGELFEAFLFPPGAACGATQSPSEFQSFERLLSELDPLSSKSPVMQQNTRARTRTSSNTHSNAGRSLHGFECCPEQSRERSSSYSSFEEEGKSDLETPVARIHLRRYNSCTTLTKKGLRRPSQYSTVETSEPLVQYAACSSWGSSWAEKSRRGSESSTFSCGSQRFRFSKSAACEGELSPIVEYDWSDCSDDGFSSDEDEEVVSILQPAICMKRGGSVLKTYDYAYSPANACGFRPFAVTVFAEDDTEEDPEKGRWSPVSIPPSQPEQEQLLSDLSRYTNRLVSAAAKRVCKEDSAICENR